MECPLCIYNCGLRIFDCGFVKIEKNLGKSF